MLIAVVAQQTCAFKSCVKRTLLGQKIFTMSVHAVVTYTGKATVACQPIFGKNGRFIEMTQKCDVRRILGHKGFETRKLAHLSVLLGFSFLSALAKATEVCYRHAIICLFGQFAFVVSGIAFRFYDV